MLGENPVEERGFAGAEKAGEDGDGNHFAKSRSRMVEEPRIRAGEACRDSA
jgi:hypothetical protein